MLKVLQHGAANFYKETVYISDISNSLSPGLLYRFLNKCCSVLQGLLNCIFGIIGNEPDLCCKWFVIEVCWCKAISQISICQF